MYRISGKQLIMLVLFSALISAVLVACVDRAIEKSEVSVAALEPVAIAEPTVATDEQNNIEIYRKYSPGVVNITNRGYKRSFWGAFPSEGTGSGAIIDDKGHILTNFHVIQGATELEVQINEDTYPARLVGSDRDHDLAVIKVEAPANKLTAIPLGTSTGLQVGQKVLAIGNPFRLQKTLTTGIISGLERPLYDSASNRTIQGAIQTDASINPGNSGGPLLNAKGEMIGINTAIYSTSGGGSVGIGFAVPVDIAKQIIPDLLAKGYVSRPWLGIATIPLDEGLAQDLALSVDRGIIIAQVYRTGGAASAGLRAAIIRNTINGAYIQQIGDVILAIDGKKVATTQDVPNALEGKKPGDTVELEILRQGRRLTVSVQLSERPRGD